MKKFDIWEEGYCCTGESGKAHCLAKDVEGEDFFDAVEKWYNNLPNPKDYGELRISHSGTDTDARIWGCRLFDNEADARKSFG